MRLESNATALRGKYPNCRAHRAGSSYGHKIRLDSTFFLIRRIRLPLRVLGRISLMAHDL